MEGEQGARVNPFEVLPEELSIRVLRELSAETLVSASAVCTHWLVLCEDEGLWRWICQRETSSKERRDSLSLYKEQSEKPWKQLYVDAVRFFPSTVVLDVDMMVQLSAWLNGNRTWKLIYRASVNGFTAKSFHKHCDKKGPTVTVCKTEQGCVLGGYNPTSWESWDSTLPPVTSLGDAPFIFSLKNPKETKPCIMHYKGSKTGVINNANYGPIWGQSSCAAVKHDLGIFGYPHNKGRWSWSRLGSFYHAPVLQYLEKEDDQHAFLAGEPHFLVEEVEVFAVEHERPLSEKAKPVHHERRKSVLTSLVNRLRGPRRNETKQ